jgi:hypothetical protein
MIHRFPNYYNEFSCIADKCEATCCAGWQIVVDEESLKKYKKVTGAFKQRIKDGVDFKEGVFYQNPGKRCAFLNEQNLCDMYTALGEEAFCETCRRYPRHIEEFENVREFTLSASCPEAARLILTAPSLPMIERQAEGGEEPEYHRETMEILLSSREKALEILARHPLKETLPLLLLYGYCVQEELDGGEKTPWDEAHELAFAAQMAEKEVSWQPLRRFYGELELLTPRWEARLKEENPVSAFSPALANMLRCQIERYWLQTISDLDLVCRVKMILAGVLLVGHLGGDLMETAQLYSKEIDNSIENIETILDSTYTHPALTDRYLLGLMETIF